MLSGVYPVAHLKAKTSKHRTVHHTNSYGAVEKTTELPSGIFYLKTLARIYLMTFFDIESFPTQNHDTSRLYPTFRVRLMSRDDSRECSHLTMNI